MVATLGRDTTRRLRKLPPISSSRRSPVTTSATGVGATGNPDIDGVLAGAMWTGGVVTYSFPDLASDYPSGYGSGEPLNDFKPISLAQQQVVHAIMQQIANFTNLTITFAGTDGADIRLAHSDSANPTAYAYYPGNYTEAGDVWFGDNYNYTKSPIYGSYEYVTHIHEIGHTLGLKHGHETGRPRERRPSC